MKKKWGKSLSAAAAAFVLGIFLIPMSASATGNENARDAAEEATNVTAGWNGFHKSPDDNDWHYYRNGQVQSGLDDVIKGTVNGVNAWWHVEDGEVTFDDTIAKNSNGWWYINNGRVDFSYNGFARNDNGTFKITNGKVTFRDNGVIKIGRSWYNLSRSRLVTGPTVEKNSNGWWYIDNTGKVDFGYNGFARNRNGWWYIRNGKVQFNTNSVLKGTVDGTNAWWYVVGGKVTFSNTVAKNSKGWWHIQKGKVNFNSNTVAKNSKGWWVIRNGKVNFRYNGFAENSNGWWYCRGGKVQFNTNSVLKGTVDGTNAWWHVVGGKVTFDTTVAKNSNGWWYIKNGKVDFTANTVAKNSNGWWVIRNGKVDFSYNGLATNEHGVWYIRNGKVDFAASESLQSGGSQNNTDNGSVSEFGEEVVRLVNQERSSRGLAPLQSDSSLRNAAAVRARELPSAFSHTRPDGSDCFTVLDELNISYRTAGENIAAGQTTPEAVVEGWMNSPGHRANILNENFTKIGVAYHTSSSGWGHYWVQLFTS